MKKNIDLSRRRFMQRTGMGLLAATAVPAWLNAMEMGKASSLLSNQPNPNFKPDVEIDLVAQRDVVSILPGKGTAVFCYRAHLVKGPKETVMEIPGSYLGPIFRLYKGQQVRINFHNKLPEPSITHWHGLHVSPETDGHPMYAIAEGGVRVYEFEVLNRAGLNIYHPHPHGATATQVYYGLAGGLIVNDQDEARLELPSGEYEIPVVIQDRRFDSQNQLLYGASMHDRTIGFYGDRILVNGQVDVSMDLASTAYRLRMINGSNARIYKLAWSDGSPLTVIGVDGGLLEVPETKPYVMMAPGERLDVWVDFTGRSKGSEVALKSLAFKGVLPKMAENRMHGGGGHGMGMMGGGLPVGSEFNILKIRIVREVNEAPRLPSHLSSYTQHSVSDVANPDHPIPIGISEGPNAMLLNGRPYAFNDVQSNERIPVNTLQLLEIFHAHGGHGDGGVNGQEMEGQSKGMSAMGGGMNMMGGNMAMMFSMAHPIHIHGQQFQVISRSSASTDPEGYASVKEGLISSGLKDTVLVMPGERVKVIKPFQDFKGLFMYHCHNLEHEDMGMMREFEIY